MGSVYVISAALRRHKVGISANPKGRLSALQTGHYERLSLTFSMQHDAASDVEGCAHHILQKRRLCGEWFDVSADCAIEAVKRAARVCNMHAQGIKLAAGDRVVCVSDGRYNHQWPRPIPGRIYTVDESHPEAWRISLVDLPTRYWLLSDCFLPAPVAAYSFGITIDAHSANNDGLWCIDDVGDVV